MVFGRRRLRVGCLRLLCGFYVRIRLLLELRWLVRVILILIMLGRTI